MSGLRAMRAERGTALVAILVILLAVFLLVAILTQLLGMQARLVRRGGALGQAFCLAESGIGLAVGRLEREEAPPDTLEVEGELESGAFHARVERVPFPGRGLALYVVTGRGESGGATRVLSTRGVLTDRGFVSLDFRQGNPPSSWSEVPGEGR